MSEIVAPEKEAAAAQRTRFERIQLPKGQLSVVRPLPPDFPPDFIDQLIEEEPWDKTGKLLDTRGRKPELFEIAGVPIVKKKSWMTGREVKVKGVPPMRHLTAAYTPSIQMATIDEAKRRYREAYRKELPLEEPIAFYINRETTEKFMFFGYLDEVKPDLSTKEGQQMAKAAEEKVYQLDKELGRVGVDRSEEYNYVVVEDPKSEDGMKVVLIDTEFWTVEPKPQRQ